MQKVLIIFALIPSLIQSASATPVGDPSMLSCQGSPVQTLVISQIIKASGEIIKSTFKGWECTENTEFSQNETDCILKIEKIEFPSDLTIYQKSIQCSQEIPLSLQNLEESVVKQPIVQVETRKVLFNHQD